ncbi:hypothetical protein [Paraclostridium sordellii]|uniref:hypothetical protein n=1 Tax=Paraclostridium sordellii TaxID=1505 RepID=UPI0005DBCAE8|nr:hypothetical protein [Paeniclostridium sordellii]MCQ4696536.1 hypothetical protein [Paeniclostridium sordellii]MDU2148235.1 hypothetical protein [Paeniclostridium sordellii]MDU6482373.1 hypothetical protein [Paeniclostridium sordellii]CEN84256.1 Uncharacterised protein [[Clostridium] sordellii] [Paeniclostridium sordellii]CEO09444.1 Uncharacterised protein [[Clostridium] sordellii] [Paeniclostridium sordellii]
MFIKKLSIIFSILLIIFTINVNTTYAFNSMAPQPIHNEYIKELEIIDNYMYLLVQSVATKNIDPTKANKDIRFIETLIDSLTDKTSKLSKEDNDIILSMQVILNYYKISIINIKVYIDKNDADRLIDSITSFSLGYNSSSTLRGIIGKAKQ